MNRTLYLLSYFFKDKPLDLLLGEDICSNDFNDDMLGRHLDAISAYGTTKLFSEITYEIGIENNLFNGCYHLDSTSFSLHGAYDNCEGSLPFPTLDYSKDHRPDLKQITVTMTQVGEADIPIWFEALDGNSSDKKNFQETVKIMKSFQTSLANMPDNIPFVVGASFYMPIITSIK